MVKTDNDDSKKLTELKELLEIIKHKVDMAEINSTSQSASISLIRDQLSVLNKKLDIVTSTLDDPNEGLSSLNKRVDANTSSVVELESTIKSYADRYVTNEDHIQRLQKRVGKVEKNLDITPPEDLTIPSFK